MTRVFRQYPICWGPLDQCSLGSSNATTWAWAMLQLAVRELQYVLNNIVIDKNILYKQLTLLFLLHFSVFQ
jgi:hypothetical protein